MAHPVINNEKKTLPARKPASDMVMYAAIAGRAPEIDPTLPSRPHKLAEPRNEKAWSPIVLSIYLKQIYRQGTLALQKPELAAWIKKQSESARKRLVESQNRLGKRKDRAA